MQPHVACEAVDEGGGIDMFAQWLIGANRLYALHPLAHIPPDEAHDLRVAMTDTVVTGRIYSERRLGDGEWGATWCPTRRSCTSRTWPVQLSP